MKSIEALNLSKKDVLYFFLLVAVSFVFVFICSVSTSPLYPDGDLADENDACQFMTIGYEWLYGKIPYKDTFDHKGPYIFFVNMLGFALTGNRTGVFIIQFINMVVILLGLDAIAKLHSTSKRYRIVVIVVTILIMRQTYAGGDRTEEFCLPFIVFSTYFQLKYLFLARSVPKGKTERAKVPNELSGQVKPTSSLYASAGPIANHRPLFALLYGATFGICLMTRATNFITVGVGALCIAGILLYGKRISCVLANAFAFIGGTALVVVPFSAYFAAMNCFDDYFFATITFNVLYSNSFGPWILSASATGLLSYLVRTISFSCALIAGVIFLALKQWRLAFYCLLCWGLEAYLFFASAAFPFYAAITTAQCVILFNAACDLKGKWGNLIKVCVCAGLILYAAAEIAITIRASYKALAEENPELIPAEECIESIPEDERQEIMLLGDNWTKPLYLEYGIHPQYKYYNIQAWHSNFSEQVSSEVRDQFEYGDARYIIADGTKAFVDDILEDRYQLISENKGIYVYELKQ